MNNFSQIKIYMKKTAIILSSLIFVAVLAGCGETTPSSDQSPIKPVEIKKSTESNTPAAVSTEKKPEVTVGDPDQEITNIDKELNDIEKSADFNDAGLSGVEL